MHVTSGEPTEREFAGGECHNTGLSDVNPSPDLSAAITEPHDVNIFHLIGIICAVGTFIFVIHQIENSYKVKVDDEVDSMETHKHTQGTRLHVIADYKLYIMFFCFLLFTQMTHMTYSHGIYCVIMRCKF